MSLVEAKQFLGTLILGSAVITIALLYIAYKFAEISYKKSHKNVKKVHKKASKNVNIVFDIGDTSKMNLFEIKQLKSQMEKELRGNP